MGSKLLIIQSSLGSEAGSTRDAQTSYGRTANGIGEGAAAGW